MQDGLDHMFFDAADGKAEMVRHFPLGKIPDPMQQENLLAGGGQFFDLLIHGGKSLPCVQDAILLWLFAKEKIFVRLFKGVVPGYSVGFPPFEAIPEHAIGDVKDKCRAKIHVLSGTGLDEAGENLLRQILRVIFLCYSLVKE